MAMAFNLFVVCRDDFFDLFWWLNAFFCDNLETAGGLFDDLEHRLRTGIAEVDAELYQRTPLHGALIGDTLAAFIPSNGQYHDRKADKVADDKSGDL